LNEEVSWKVCAAAETANQMPPPAPVCQRDDDSPARKTRPTSAMPTTLLRVVLRDRGNGAAEPYAKGGGELERVLRARRDGLAQASRDYYRMLAGEADLRAAEHGGDQRADRYGERSNGPPAP
jgi:hypothetical protein